MPAQRLSRVSIYVVTSVAAIICYSNVGKLKKTAYLGGAGPTGSGRPASEFCCR